MARKVVVTENLVIQPLNDEAVALDVNHEVYFSFNNSAYHMWQVLTSASTVDEALRQLGEYYDVPEDVLRDDVELFLNQLQDNQLISIEDT